MKQFIRGQKEKISAFTDSRTLRIRIQGRFKGSYSMLGACVGFEARDPVGAPYLLGTSNPRSPCGAIQMIDARTDEMTFVIRLDRLPESIQRLRFVLGTRENRSFQELMACSATLFADDRQQLIFSLTAQDFEHEKAAILCDLYLAGEWRFGAIGQGFLGGMTALLRELQLSEHSDMVIPPEDEGSVGRPAPRSPSRTATSDADSLEAPLTLENRGDRHFIRLEHLARTSSPMISFVCRDLQTGTRLDQVARTLKRTRPELGCMYVLEDGARGVVQSLGGVYGSRLRSPYTHVDRSQKSGLETLVFYRPELIKLVMVYLYIHDETKDFEQVENEVVVSFGDGRITLPLVSRQPEGFCSLCLLARDGAYLAVIKDERYFNDHQAADLHYGFGFRWE